MQIPEELYLDLTPQGSFVIGQEQDGILVGGFFDIQQAYSGKMTQVEMWHGSLTPEEIDDIANCRKETTKPGSKIISWSTNWTVHDVNIEDVELGQLCVQDPLLNRLIWPDTIPYSKFRPMCDTLSAKLPVLNDSEANHGLTSKLHQENFRRFEVIYEMTGNRKCYINNENVIFWLANQQSGNTSWIDPYTGEELPDFITNDAANGLGCCYLFGIRVECSACSSKFPCGVCELPSNKLLYLKGLCKDDMQKLYDVQYYVHGVHDGLPHFRCVILKKMMSFLHSSIGDSPRATSISMPLPRDGICNPFWIPTLSS